VPLPLRRFFRPKSLAGKAAAVGLLLVAILISIYLSARHYTSRRLAEAWKLGEEFGLPSDLRETLGPYIPDAENAAIPLDQAATIADNRLTAARIRWKLGSDDEGLDNSSYIADVSSILDDPTYEANLNAAAARPGYYSPIQFDSSFMFSRLDHVMRRYRAAQMEKILALKSAADGKREEAVRRLLRWIHITRKWEGREPFVRGVLSNMNARYVAVDALNVVLRAGGPLPAELHTQVDQALLEHESILKTLPYCYQSERHLHAAEIQRFGTMVALPPLGLGGGLLADHRMARMLANGHRIASAWEKPFAVVKAEERLIRQEIARGAGSPLYAHLSGGADSLAGLMYFVKDVGTRQIARARCLRIVNAWAARGDFTVSIDALGLSDECLIDPFDGNRLRVFSSPGGPVVYAVGANLKDDGGDVGTYPQDQGLGPVKKSERK
jgi:hypothetical protein